VSNPAWSPDGKSIAFLGRRTADDPVNLWVMDTEGGGLRSVVPLPAKLDQDATGLSAFAWAPDSLRFVVLSDHAGPCYHNSIEGGGACNSSLHLVNADGTGLARLGPYTQSRFNVWLAWIP
jgi:Tol biopolymer transport system component